MGSESFTILQLRFLAENTRPHPRSPEIISRIKQCGDTVFYRFYKNNHASRQWFLQIYIWIFVPLMQCYFLPFRCSGNCDILTLLWSTCFFVKSSPPDPNRLHFLVKFYFAVITPFFNLHATRCEVQNIYVPDCQSLLLRDVKVKTK